MQVSAVSIGGAVTLGLAAILFPPVAVGGGILASGAAIMGTGTAIAAM
jgi:hypothetical protein